MIDKLRVSEKGEGKESKFLFSVFAPGRVNLIGEHTDYNDGFVFPAAINLGITVRFYESDTGLTELYSAEAGGGEVYDGASVKPGELLGWSKYPAGVAWAFQEKYGASVPNIFGDISSTLPMGASLSSSAAIELAFATAYDQLLRLGKTPKDLALVSQYAENKFVGVNCGIMDQLASALGEAGKALFIDTRTLNVQSESLPTGVSIIVCDTTTSRELAGSAYNERRSQCELAAKLLGVGSLRDTNLAQLQAISSTIDPIIFRRAKHVITENTRCVDFLEALNAKDKGKLGKLMRESHASLRDDYAVSSFALDQMSDIANSMPGCIGARMTGAGFGGACVALVEEIQQDQFLATVQNEFFQRTGIVPKLIPCQASAGAHILPRT